MNLTELTKSYDFTGKTVVITGGAGILGGELACALVGCNANVAIVDRDPALADRLMVRLKSNVGRAIVVFGDVLDVSTLRQAVDEIVKEFGKVDCLVNAAGGNKPQATTSPDLSFFDLPIDALRWVFDLNIVGTMLPCQIFGKQMAQRGDGVILNISSMNAFRPLTRIPAYSAAKAGVSNFTEWLAVHMAQEYSPRIRVNAIAPGWFPTDMTSWVLDQHGKKILSLIPMGRFGEAEELKGAVVYLASEASRYVTGIVLPVDGGLLAV